MKKKMKNYLLVAVMIISLFPMHASASESITLPENHNDRVTLLKDDIFISNAEVRRKELSPNVFEYELTLTERKDMKSSSIEDEVMYKSAKIIAFNEEEANKIEKGIREAKAAKGSSSLSDSETFYGGSLYMEISANATTKREGLYVFYKINSVEVSSIVRNGTVMNNRLLNLGAMGVKENGQAYSNDVHLNITTASNPYTNTTQNSWPFIREGSMLGASYVCTVSRSGGTPQTFTLGVDFFL